MYSYPEHIIGKLNYTKIAFSMINYIPDSIISVLKGDRMDSLKSAVYEAALESYRNELDLQGTRALTMKKIRSELANNGIRRTSRYTEDNKTRLLQTEFTRDYVSDKENLDFLDREYNEEMGEIMDLEQIELTLPSVLIDALLDISNELEQTMDETATEAMTIGLGEINDEIS